MNTQDLQPPYKQGNADTGAQEAKGIPTEDGIRWQSGNTWPNERKAVTVDGRTWYRDDYRQVASPPPQSLLTLLRHPGFLALRNVVETLRATGNYADEEGEATNHLIDLMVAIGGGEPAPPQSTGAQEKCGDCSGCYWGTGKCYGNEQAAPPSAPQEAQPQCSMSWGGFNLHGDEKSIKKAQAMLHDSEEVVPSLRNAIAEMKTQASQSAPGEADMRAICEALGFDPTNHHNAAKCPYCRPATNHGAPGLTLEVLREILVKHDRSLPVECADEILAATHSTPVAGMTLTDEEILKVALSLSYNERHDAIKFARAIEAALREKAGGKP